MRLLAALLASLMVALGLAGPAATPPATAAVPLSIAVSGNHFVDGSGATVRLLGVNHPSLEYACQQGWGYDDGMMDAADAAAIASWHATAVRVPLNEDCWLGINGQPSGGLTRAGYRAAVTSYVAQLHAHGLYAILDLHWSAPGATVADGQRPMPDDHSAAFWSDVATTFKADPAVVFDAFNEPIDPARTNDKSHPVSWSCWRDGGCSVPGTNDQQAPGNHYPAVGMQAVVDAIRATGARQPVLLGGLDYANDLTGWLSHKPNDPLGQLAASFHNYQGQACDDAACWNATIAPVAASVPVVTGEFDQDVCGASTFAEDYMRWADSVGVGYLAWGWWLLSAAEIKSMGCSAYYLISDRAGTPAAPNGTALHDHLAALPAAGAAPALSALRTKVKGRSLRVVLTSSQDVTARVSALTKATFGRRHHRKHLSLGATTVALRAGQPGTATLHLSKAVRAALAARGRLKVRLTVVLGTAATDRGVTLRRPRR